MITTIKNEYLTLQVNSQGAEVVSLKNNKTGREVIWTGDPTYWDEHSPLLFPCVGGNWDGKIRLGDKEYALKKHGFAKDMAFNLIKQEDEALTYELNQTSATLEAFPFPFRLTAHYVLKEKSLVVNWEVTSPGATTAMPFMIGAHPALLLPDFNPQDAVHGYLVTNDVDCLVSHRTLPYGFIMPGETEEFPLEQGTTLPLRNGTFSCDTILDTSQAITSMALCGKDKTLLETMNWTSGSILALWSPQDGCCPFVCIEPWWGCCDEYQSTTLFNERPFVNLVKPNETLTLGYCLKVEDF